MQARIRPVKFQETTPTSIPAGTKPNKI